MKISVYLRQHDADTLNQLVNYYRETHKRSRITGSWVVREAIWLLYASLMTEIEEPEPEKPPYTAEEFLAKGKEALSRVKEGDYAPGVDTTLRIPEEGDGTEGP